MKVTIYQINNRRDVNNVKFRNYDFTQTHQRVPGVESVIYDKVYTAEVAAKNLKDVYYIFNQKHPEDFRGHSLSVSDVVEVSGHPDGKDGFYFCDSVGFRKVDFDPIKTQEYHLFNMKELNAEAKANPETGFIHMEARLGISLEVTPEEFKALHGADRAAQELLVKLIQSDRCVMGGDTYFPEPWNEGIIDEDLNFDLPNIPFSVAAEKKTSLDEKIQASEARAASQKLDQATGKVNDIMR